MNGTVLYCVLNLHVSHLYARQWRKGEQLGHPQLKVEAEAVEEGPDVNQLTRAQPQGGDGEGAEGRQELLEDFVVIPADVVVNIPAKVTTPLQPDEGTTSLFPIYTMPVLSL